MTDETAVFCVLSHIGPSSILVRQPPVVDIRIRHPAGCRRLQWGPTPTAVEWLHCWSWLDSFQSSTQTRARTPSILDSALLDSDLINIRATFQLKDFCIRSSINDLYYNSPYGLGHCLSLPVCGAYFWSLQTEFWADRFAKCLKMFHLTYFLYYKVLAFSSAAFIEKTQNGYLC